MTDQKQTEQEILFPEMEVDGVRVKPWTLKQFTSLFPWAQKIVVLVKENKISPDDLKKFAEAPTENIDALIGLLGNALPLMPELIEKSTGIAAAESEEWVFDKALRVSLMIFSANANRLKNLFGLASGMMRTAKS